MIMPTMKIVRINRTGRYSRVFLLLPAKRETERDRREERKSEKKTNIDILSKTMW